MKILVGDIGGSNIRLSACEIVDNHVVRLYNPFRCSTADVTTLSEVVERYLDVHRGERFVCGVFAVAAPTNGTHARLTNALWTANVHRLPFPSVLLNDLEAAGWGVMQKGLVKQTLQIGSSSSSEVESSLLGVGTGLGLAHCFPAQSFVSPTEFGHVSFAPFNEDTMSLWQWWRRDAPNRLTIEDVCSGRGLVNLFRFVVEEKTAPTDDVGFWSEPGIDLGEMLSIEHHKPIAQKVWTLFFSILGSVCGDVIVGNRSHHLYLCGGVLDKNIPLFLEYQQTFQSAMLDKKPMSHLVQEASVTLFAESKLQQFGCGLWYAQQQG